MYTQQPQPTSTQPIIDGMNSMSFSINFQIREVPDKMDDFLQKTGWMSCGAHPDTREKLYRKPCPDNATDEIQKEWPYELGSGYWHWYEAVAYEFGKFMTIGDDVNG